MQTKKYVMLKDEVANIILTDKSCREYVESIVSSALGIDKELISLELLTTRINSNTNVKHSYVDSIYENNDNSFIVDIEVNTTNTKRSKRKNLRYICHMILNDTKPGDMDKLDKKIYQININSFDIFGKNEFIYKSSIREEKYNIIRNDDLLIVDINLAFLENMPYTKIKKEDSLKRLLYIFICEDKENLDKLYSNDKIMIKVRNKMENLTGNFLDDLYYDRETQKNAELYELGTIDKTKEIAKALLEDTKNIEYVSKITKLSLEEIEALIKEQSEN